MNEEQERLCPHRLAVRRFMNATAHLPTAEEQCRTLQKEVVNICDNDLIQSLEAVLADAGLNPHASSDRIAKYAATYHLLLNLRKLHMIRLRDAMSHLVPADVR